MKKLTQNDLNTCKSIADVCRFMGWVPSGGNYVRAKELIKDLDSSHFRKGPWNKNKKIKHTAMQSLDEILVKNSTYKSTNHLKDRLISAGLKENKCEIPGCNYCSKLELHHINGDPTDNRLENLQLLCPNHHSETPNFRGKNSSIASHGRLHRSADEMYITEEEAEERYQQKLARKREYSRAKYKELHPNAKEGIRIDTKREVIKCPICGKEFNRTKRRTKYCSDDCRKQGQIENGKRPQILELLNVLKQTKSFVGTAKHYGVCDNSVRKWCKLYKLPFHTKELLELIKE